MGRGSDANPPPGYRYEIRRAATHEPLFFLGSKFKASSNHWAIIEKKAFAIVESCTRLDYLLQREAGFRIYADYKNLVYLFDPQ